MTEKGRVKGYLLGKDSCEGVATWKIRVTDESSPFMGEKLFVASIHDDIQLAQGCEVTFLVAAFTGRNKETYYKALDVALPVVVPKCDFCDHVAEVGIEVTDYTPNGPAEHIRSCIACISHALLQGQTTPVIEAKTKKFSCVNFSAGEKQMRRMNGVC